MHAWILTLALMSVALYVTATVVLGRRLASWQGTVEGVAPKLPTIAFVADDSGYTITDMRRAMGAPTLTINQDNDVFVVAVGSNGDTLSSISVPNPRVVRTAGSRNPDSAVLSQATFTVSFANPGAIERLSLSVRKGPNGEYKREFSVREYQRQVR